MEISSGYMIKGCHRRVYHMASSKVCSHRSWGYSDLEMKPVGILEVKLVQTKELTNKDLIGKSDPFDELYVCPLCNRIKKSKTINNQLNPVWNEHFDFMVEDVSTQQLVVKIYDEEGVQESELIGCAQMYLKELEPGKVLRPSTQRISVNYRKKLS